MKNLNLYTRCCKSRSRAWWNDTPHQLRNRRFDKEGDLGHDSTLPLGLSLFLVEDSAKEQGNTPGIVTPMHEEPLLLPPYESLQHYPTHTGGSRPKTLAHASANQSWSLPQSKLKEPDLVTHPHRWIHVEMERFSHCQWWKELKHSG